MAGFKRFCSELGLRLERFQERMLTDHFRGVEETVIVLPEGNGKTTILAALALFHLKLWPNAEVTIAASTRDQAGVLYGQAVGLIRDSGLEARDDGPFAVRTGLREIRLHLPGGPRFKMAGAPPPGRLKVLAADAGTADGVIPTLALVDELHRHRSGELYGVFRGKLGKRGGRMVTISTAGSKADSPLGELREAAHGMSGFKRRGVYNYVATRSFAWHEWCLENTDDLDDIALVKKANPASFVTREELKSRKASPSMTPGRWARFAAGVWTEGEEPWVDPPAWDRLGAQVGGVSEGDEVWACVRVGAGAAVALVSPREEGLVCRAEIIPPPPGGRVAYERAEDLIQDLAQRYALREVAYDRGQFGRSAELLWGEGIPMVEVPQRTPRLVEASGTLWSLISSGKLGHDGASDLRAQVLAGRTKETTTGWHLVPTDKTEALIALAVCCHQATLPAAQEPMVAYI